jgi:hypothetical protein
MDRNCKLKYAKVLALVVIGVAAMGLVVMALWNWLIPGLFAGGREIGYAQALGVLLLSKILFGGFGGHGGRGRLHRHRLANLTPQERAALLACGSGCGAKAAESQ